MGIICRGPVRGNYAEATDLAETNVRDLAIANVK